MKTNTNDHQKYYNSSGDEIPSVTTVLKLLNPNLDGWANYMGLKGVNTKIYVKHKADRGSYIHSICDMFFKNELPENLEDFELDTEFLIYDDFLVLHEKLTIIKELFYRRGFEYFASELSISGDTYGGTIDLVFYNKDTGEYVIADFKTSKKAYSKYFIQLAGYTMLFRMKYGFNVKAVCVILIDNPINAKDFISIRQVEKNEYNVDIFIDLLNIYYLMTESERRFYFGTD